MKNIIVGVVLIMVGVALVFSTANATSADGALPWIVFFAGLLVAVIGLFVGIRGSVQAGKHDAR